MVLQVPAMMAVIGYFVIVVYAGVRFGRKTHVFKDAFQLSHIQEQQKLFGTDSHLSLLLAICSMTAAWVGGGYLNGTAEAVYMRGLLYCHAPIGYAISLVIGGIFFAEKMRTANAVTMLDPFQAQYGRWMGLLLCLPAVCGELLWTAAMFSALGYTADVIMGIDASLFIIVASTAIFIYTALGGYYSITYTDALQIGSTAACLWSCVPFVVTNPGIGTVGPPQNDWSGSTALGNIGQTFDVFLMTSLGGIPWQVYFQRVLGCKNDFNAKMISFVAAIGSFAMAVPAAVIGATAKTTNLTALGYAGPWPLSDGDGARVLPLAIQYLAPGSVSVLGLVGVTAAVMSSADSSMLSASAMITRNIYHAICRPQPLTND
ncbi:high-affinity choline transporter 1-like [Haemaphysalis longicornis]